MTYVVCPFPYKPALQTRILIKSIHILLNPPRSIPHRMDILTQHHRLRLLIRRHKLNELLHTMIHPAKHIRALSIEISLVMHRPRLIIRLDELVHRLVVPPIRGLVAERPDDDARVILVTHHHLPRAVHVRLFPPGVIARPGREVGA